MAHVSRIRRTQAIPNLQLRDSKASALVEMIDYTFRMICGFLFDKLSPTFRRRTNEILTGVSALLAANLDSVECDSVSHTYI